MIRTVLALLVLLISFTSNLKAKSLEDIVKEIGLVPPQELLKDIKELPQQERIKLQVLMLSYFKEEGKVKELIQNSLTER